MSECLQYYYADNQDSEKYKIDCSNKVFEYFSDYSLFSNNKFLEWIQKEYGSEAFPDAKQSPFSFKTEYMNETNEEICNLEEYSLKPQQKFAGQFTSPNTNFKSSLIFHGLGSGKTCTSLIVGEAFKNKGKKLLYVVPAPLVDQYYEEILGIIKNNENWSCTSQCIINGKRETYLNINDDSILNNLRLIYELSIKELINIDETDTKRYSVQENVVRMNKKKYDTKFEQMKSKVTKIFEITSHDKFINSLFKENNDGTVTLNKKLDSKDKKGRNIIRKEIIY